MSKKRQPQLISLQSEPEKEENLDENLKGTFVLSDLLISVYSRNPQAASVFEIYRMVQEMSQRSEECARQQTRLVSCLYALLGIFLATSVSLAAVLYAIGMATIGLSFVGPAITGVIGVFVVWKSGRNK